MNSISSFVFLFYAFIFFNQPLNKISFYDYSNDKLLKLQQYFISSKTTVQDIYSLKSDEKSRVLILDYVEAYDQLLSISNSVSELLNIYHVIPKIKINNELLKSIEKKITICLNDISNNLEVLIDSFDFYIKSEFYNYKEIMILKSRLILALNEIRVTIDQS